jgi:hypothetical protein
MIPFRAFENHFHLSHYFLPRGSVVTHKTKWRAILALENITSNAKMLLFSVLSLAVV